MRRHHSRPTPARAASAAPFQLRMEILESRDVPTYYGHQIFPLDNPWNQNVASAPVAGNSDAIISRIVGRHTNTLRLHADFGNPVTDGELYGIPVNVVDGSVPKVSVVIPPQGYDDESDLVQVPIPVGAVIEGDGATGPAPSTGRGDSHLLVYDRTANVLYELYQAIRPTETQYPYGGTKPLGVWGAYQISYWDLNTNHFRTIGATSADAAGLPILPGLVRPDEALPPSAGGQGVITHAIRFTVQQTRSEYVFPASHEASSLTDANLPRMGERFRLKSSFVIPSNWSPEAKAIAQAMKDYGLIVADNGSDMFFQGTPSTQWNMSSVLQIQQIAATNFEVVDLTPRVTGLSVNYGQPSGGTPVTITGQNFSGAAGQLQVLFGTTPASSVTILSDTRLVAVAPAHAVGTVDLRVRSGANRLNTDGQPEFFGYGTSAVTPAARFTFDVNAPPPPPGGGYTGGELLAVGGSADGGVQVFAAGAGSPATLAPFGAVPANVRTATADVNGDTIPDTVLVTGPGTPIRVAVVSGADNATVLVQPFDPFGGDFLGGGFVTAADFDRDGRSEFVVTPDQGGGPRISIFSLGTGGAAALRANFLTIEESFRGGARPGAGDINGDGTPDLVVSAGFLGGPRIVVLDGRRVLSVSNFTSDADKLVGDFFAFSPELRNGAYVAIGDVNGDGFGDLVFGAGPGGGPEIRIASGQTLLTAGSDAALSGAIADFFLAGDLNNRGGVRVTVKDVDGDNRADVVAGTGGGQASFARVYLGASFGGAGEPTAFQDLNPFASAVLADGVYVG